MRARSSANFLEVDPDVRRKAGQRWECAPRTTGRRPSCPRRSARLPIGADQTRTGFAAAGPVLRAQFSHVSMLRPVHPAAVRKAQCRATLFKETHGGIQRLLLSFGQAIPPVAELVGVFDIPTHGANIGAKAYSVNGMPQAAVASRPDGCSPACEAWRSLPSNGRLAPGHRAQSRDGRCRGARWKRPAGPGHREKVIPRLRRASIAASAHGALIDRPRRPTETPQSHSLCKCGVWASRGRRTDRARHPARRPSAAAARSVQLGLRTRRAAHSPPRHLSPHRAAPPSLRGR